METRLKKKFERRSRIRMGIRKKIIGTHERPRLSVFRSNTEIYAQLVDDIKGITLVASSSRDPEFKNIKKTKVEIAKMVGEQLAAKAVKENLTKVIFDRGGYLYHGRVKSLADGARVGGLIF
jgi:large subunit ribosomal protein L18